MTAKYADLMDQPIRYTETEAWICIDGKWQPIHTAEVYHKARTLTADKYRAMYGQSPPLPITAFQEGGSRAATSR